MNRRHGMDWRWWGRWVRHPCSVLELSTGWAATLMSTYRPTLHGLIAKLLKQTPAFIRSFTLTHKNNPTCVPERVAEEHLGTEWWSTARDRTYGGVRLWKNSRKGRSGLRSFPGVFGSFRFQDDISAVGGVLLRQKRDKKGPEESGGPVWERHEKATAPGSRKGRNTHKIVYKRHNPKIHFL